MDNYNKEATQSKVRYSINPDGKVEFDANGLEEWQLTEALSQVSTQAREQRRSAQKLSELKMTSELAMHCLAVFFLTLVVTGTTFTMSRVVSGMVQSGEHHVK